MTVRARDLAPALQHEDVEMALMAANAFSRLSEAQRRTILTKDPLLGWALMFPKEEIPERQKSLKGKKKTLEDEMNDPKNENFQVFYQYYVELKNNAQETMIEEAIKAISSDVEDAPLELNDIPKMEESLMKLGAALAGSDVQSMLLFLKLYKQFFEWSRVISKNGFDNGLTAAQIRQTLGDACLKLTRFKIDYLNKMQDVISLIHLYPRLKWAGTTRDILYHHQERFRIYLKKNANEAEFWRQDINRPYLIGLKIRHKIPHGLREEDILRKMGNELYLGDIVTPEGQEHVRSWVLSKGGVPPKRKELSDQDRADSDQVSESDSSIYDVPGETEHQASSSSTNKSLFKKTKI